MNLILVTGPTSEPVTLEELRLQRRLPEGHDDDNELARYISAAREQYENYECQTKVQLINATYEARFDEFPEDDGRIVLPLPPLGTVTSITYIDAGGTEATFGLDEASPPAVVGYTVDARGIPQKGEIQLAYGYSWPTIQAVANAVRVRFTAGYGATPEHVPADIRNWILMLAATLHEHREFEIVGGNISKFDFVDRMIDRYRRYEVV